MHRLLQGGPTVMTRTGLLAAFAMMVGASSGARAQVSEAEYKARREQLQKELDATQKALADAKGQRVQLQARVEALIAQAMQERSQALLLSNETTALQQLDALLATSQDNLSAQRDRFAALSDAVAARSGATLVILLRADSSSQPQNVQSAVATVDSVAAQTRTYNSKASGALAQGAVDQLYRAPVVPSDHAVAVQITVDGRTLTGSTRVPVSRQAVTYVQFIVRNGQVTFTTWQGSGPF
jgi:hypothetical protein